MQFVSQSLAFIASLLQFPEAPRILDSDLSLDDKHLYVACWGTGELRQYDVSDPMEPKLAGSVRVGGIVNHTPHANGKAFGGGPQMVEISRDGKRVYFTNSLYSSWDKQFYPDGIPGVQAMCNVNGSFALDKEFYVDFGRDYGAPVIDARAWLADDCFRDGQHLTPAGAALYRMIAAEYLGPGWEDDLSVWREYYREGHRYCETEEGLQGVLQRQPSIQ